MIVQDTVQNDVIGLDKDTTLRMTIDRSSDKILMMVLSQNLYSDGIGSLIREYTTNALDAQREAQNNEPIKVKLIKENDQFVFIVQDEGVGLSPERIENTFAKYLSSTKRNDENQMGWYGLGSKSALSYVDSFHVISRFDGKEYDFLMLKGAEGTELSLLDINDTTEHNGVQIKVYLNDDDDYETFLEKMKHQLCYFEGVFIETEYNDIESDYKIIKTTDWKYSELNQDKYMHLSLDNVYYPLDFEKLGIEPIKMPIAICLSLKDNIIPTPNRENIIYNTHVKELIISKIKSVGKYFIEKWNTVAPFATNIEEGHRIHNNLGEICIYDSVDLNGNNKKISVKVDRKLEKICEVEMKSVTLELFPNLSIEFLHDNMAFFYQEYRIYGKFQYNNYKTKFGTKLVPKQSDSLVYNEIASDHIILLENGEEISKLQIEYLRFVDQNYYVVRKHTTTKLGKLNRTNYYNIDNYRGLLKLHKKPKELIYNNTTGKWESSWRKIIQEYQAFLKSYTDQFIKIDSIVPTQEFFDWKEKNKKERKKARCNSKEEISFYTIRHASRGSHIFVKDNKKTIKICDLHKQIGLFMFLHEDDIDEINEYYSLTSIISKLNIVVFTDHNYKKLIKEIEHKPIHNWMHFKTFFDKKNKNLANKLTSYLCCNIHKKFLNRHQLNKNSYIIEKNANKNFDKIYELIQDYSFYSISESNILKYIKLYAKNNWFNQNIITDFKREFTNVHKFDFMDAFNFYYKDQKLIKKFALSLYLKQRIEEKKRGIITYQRYDIDNFITKFLQEPEIIITSEMISPIINKDEDEIFDDDEEEVLVSNSVPVFDELDVEPEEEKEIEDNESNFELSEEDELVEIEPERGDEF